MYFFICINIIIFTTSMVMEQSPAGYQEHSGSRYVANEWKEKIITQIFVYLQIQA